MDLLKKVHIFESMRTHIYESNISLINLTKPTVQLCKTPLCLLHALWHCRYYIFHCVLTCRVLNGVSVTVIIFVSIPHKEDM